MSGWGNAVADHARDIAWDRREDEASLAGAVRHLANTDTLGDRHAALGAGWNLRTWRHRQEWQGHRALGLKGLEPGALLWGALRDAAAAEFHRVRGSDLALQIVFCRSAEAYLRSWWRVTDGGAR